MVIYLVKTHFYCSNGQVYCVLAAYYVLCECATKILLILAGFEVEPLGWKAHKLNTGMRK